MAKSSETSGDVSRRRSTLIGAAVLSLLCAPMAHSAADLSGLASILNGMNDGTWQSVSLNSFSSAWPSAQDSVGVNSYSNPAGVIAAWSGFGWDSTRGDLLLFGGGHANYAGNEVYRWDGTSRLWERASLPSRVVEAPGNWVAADGPMNAPTSAHTYDTTNYLPGVDRLLVMGGAAFPSGGAFTIPTGQDTYRTTGPYLFDPAKADGSQVGGTTGSAVNPAVQGGQMWQNRDQPAFSNLVLVNGTSAAATEGGRDVVYFTASSGGGTNSDLYRYTVVDANNPSLDSVELVGQWWSGAYAQGGGAYDPKSRLFVAPGDADHPFVVWDMDDPTGPNNHNSIVTPTILGGEQFVSGSGWSVDWDPARGKFVAWKGGGEVWALEAPAGGTISGEWTLQKWSDGGSMAAGSIPPETIENRVLGKWKYVAELNAFIALEGAVDGNVWLFKPIGNINPVPEPSNMTLLVVGAAFCGLVIHHRRRRSAGAFKGAIQALRPCFWGALGNRSIKLARTSG